MKLRNLTAAAFAAFGITLALTPVSANAAETAPQTETTAAFTSTATLPPETFTTVSERADDEYDYEAHIIFDKISQDFYTGDEPVLDPGKVTLTIALRDPEGTYSKHLTLNSFRADGETLKGCFRFDTSELDTTQAGWQPVYVETIGGTYAEFDAFASYPGDPYSGKMRVRFNDYRFARSVNVKQKSMELRFADSKFSSATDIDVPLEPRFPYFAMHLYNAWDAGITYTLSDPTVAEIAEVQRTADQHNEWFKVIPHKLGDTELTATASDGRTVTCTLHVIPTEDYYPPVETGTTTSTAVWSSAETTFTTAKTTASADDTTTAPETTAESETTVTSPETTAAETSAIVPETTVTETETTVSAAETTVTETSDLPQTGNNNYTALLTLLGALTLTGAGAWVLRRSKAHDEA